MGAFRVVLGTPAHAGNGSNDYISNRTEFRVMASGDDILRALARQQFAGRNSSPVDRFLTDALTEAGGKIAGGAQSVARALMTPGDAMRGAYNYAEINPDGSVNPVPTAMIDDAANMAGVISLGAMPMVRPSGSLGMGGRIASDIPPDGFPIRAKEPFSFMHNTEGAHNYVPKGSSATALDPNGRFIIHDEGGLGAAPDSRWIKGSAEFQNPLIIEWDGWKERLSSAYGGATGRKLTELLKKDGYDGIVTFDKYGPSEIVDLK